MVNMLLVFISSSHLFSESLRVFRAREDTLLLEVVEAAWGTYTRLEPGLEWIRVTGPRLNSPPLEECGPGASTKPGL
jgi:hypothetical protein